MANQYEPDPRQALFLENYLKPGTPTFSNIYQSALKAGYSEEYAKSFQTKGKEWLSENLGEITKDELVKKSKRVLNKSLDSLDERLAQDTAKFIAKTDLEFSEKQEVDLKGNIEINIVNFADADNSTL